MVRGGKLRTAAIILVLAVLAPLGAWAEEDTPATRRAAAERYVAVAHFDELMDNVIVEMAASYAPTPSSRQKFLDFMHRQIDAAVLHKIFVDVAIQYFTLDELNALAEFYGSDTGQSIMRKVPVFMGAAMPVMMQEMARAAGSFQAEP
jgi:hypothetical protein